MALLFFMQRTTDHIIPRRPECPTWESPGTMYVPAQQIDRCYQEIAPQAFLSVPRRFAPRNDKCCRLQYYKKIFSKY